jgi:sugar phosphate isomerase/epimerase
MTLKVYFASSSKVWDSVDWVFGIEECGYDGWEISADGNYRLDDRENLARILDVIGSTRLGVTVHAPFTDLNLASLNYPIYRESIRQLKQCVEAAAALTDRVTIHPGYLSPAGRLVPGKVWELHKSALAEIGAFAVDVGVLVCLENMINIDDFLCRMPEELFGMTESLEGIGVTLDVGHAHTVGRVDDFLARIREVRHLHLHDNHGDHDAHLPLGWGSIDWARAGRIIREGYRGICVVEGRNLAEAGISRGAFGRWFV